MQGKEPPTIRAITIRSNAVINVSNRLVLADSTAGNITIIIQDLVSIPQDYYVTHGVQFSFKKIVAANTVTIQSLNPLVKFDGASTLTLSGLNESVIIQYNGYTFSVVGEANVSNITPAALTKTDDTNVTATLTGTPTTALLQSVNIALGWTGTLADARITSSANWNVAYTNRITSLTVTGTSGAATLISNTLNIPQYQAANTYVAKTSGYTLTTSDGTVDATSGTFTLTLPTAVGVSAQVYTLKNSGTGVITIATTSSQTIDSVASGIVTLHQGQSLTVQSDNANWKVIAEKPSNWIDYSGTSTIVGWSAFTVKEIIYQVSFGTLHVIFQIDGTSNSATTTFTMPLSAPSANGILLACLALQNLTPAMGRYYSTASSNVMTFNSDLVGTGWAAVNRKRISDEYWIKLY